MILGTPCPPKTIVWMLKPQRDACPRRKETARGSTGGSRKGPREIAEEAGLAQTRVSQLVLTSCTQVQKTDMGHKKNYKNINKFTLKDPHFTTPLVICLAFHSCLTLLVYDNQKLTTCENRKDLPRCHGKRSASTRHVGHVLD